MSVIAKNMKTGHFRAFVKGSPEKIRELALPGSLPDNFEEVLQIYTESGYRVLGIATKSLPKMNYIKS